ncbi:MAG TPA: hypothetical protein DCL61_02180 [Cyanobacteria bacterium UBA12227]|nr:hypothetical protein [Cyanobacteria bacterium UBA12227]HAX85990.1 hypothetical protein [Cyanobacteria bacterium UBA11370]HBY80445.1 hypothetical protein [Cyanobacteria bacterium UBA11148]
MNNILSLAERAFVVFSLLVFMQAFIPAMRQALGLPIDQGDPISTLFGLLILIFTLFLLVIWYKRVLRVVIKEQLLWILIAIANFSLFWSVAPEETHSNLIILGRITLFGIYFAARYNRKEQLQLLAWTFGIAAVFSLVFALALPTYGLMGRGSVLTPEDMAHAGTWRGVYSHKNLLGRAMVLGGCVFLLFANSNRKYSWVGWTGFVLSIILILGCTSKTALVSLLTLLMLMPLYRALRWNYSVALPFFITTVSVGGSLAIVLVSNAESILGAMGKDLTFTGRVPLWAAVIDKISEHPWLGYGYDAFWLGLDGESAQIWRMLGWAVPHAHNGFIDLCVDLGLIGLSVFVVSYFATYIRAIAEIRKTKTGEGLLPLIYLTFFVLANLTESTIRQNFFWVMYVVITLSTHNNFTQEFEQKQVQPEVKKSLTHSSQGG